jgi:hypothetical protein
MGAFSVGILWAIVVLRQLKVSNNLTGFYRLPCPGRSLPSHSPSLAFFGLVSWILWVWTIGLALQNRRENERNMQKIDSLSIAGITYYGDKVSAFFLENRQNRQVIYIFSTKDRHRFFLNLHEFVYIIVF